MKLFISLIFTSFQILALDYGQCLAKPSSKKYIDADFHANFPKTISFSCDYECMGEGQSAQLVKAISKITVGNFDQEATNLVCQGVLVKKSKWGYEFDKVTAFFVYDTNLKEINNFGKNNNISVDDPSAQALNEKMQQTLASVGKAYELAGKNSSQFAQAALILEQMSTDLSLIDTYIEELRLISFIVSKDFTAKNLVFNILLTQARHRIIL